MLLQALKSYPFFIVNVAGDPQSFQLGNATFPLLRSLYMSY